MEKAQQGGSKYVQKGVSSEEGLVEKMRARRGWV